MTRLQEQVWDALIPLSSEALVRTFVNYHGMQLLNGEFAEFLVDEGILDPKVTGRNDEDDE